MTKNWEAIKILEWKQEIQNTDSWFSEICHGPYYLTKMDHPKCKPQNVEIKYGTICLPFYLIDSLILSVFVKSIKNAK